MLLTTSSTVPAAVTSWFSKELLIRALPALVHGKVAQRKRLPGRNSKTIVFRRFDALSLATTPLVEGVTPDGSQLANTDISASVLQYGDFVTLTDLVVATTESDVLREASKVLGEQAGQTIDALMRDAYAAGTTVLYGGAETARTNLLGVAHKVDSAILQRAIRQLQSQNAKPFTRMITATDKVSTQGIRPAYWAITSPEVLFTLESLSGWTPVEKYASQGPVMEAEVGSYRNLRFLVSTQAKSFADAGGTAVGDVKSTTGTKADVHTILVFGQDAVGVVPLDNLSFENIIHMKGQAGVGDPLNQLSTSGWKRTGTELILNDNFLVRIEVAVADNEP